MSKLNKLEKKVESEFKSELKKRGWLVRSIEGKAGEVNGSPDVLGVSPRGTNIFFELKTLSKLSAGQILILKRSRFAFLVVPDLENGGYIFKYLYEDVKFSEWNIEDIEKF